MSKLLVCGLCPLPFENTRQNYGPGIRTWQFAHSLAQAGHEVHLVAMQIPGVYEAGEAVEHEERDGVVIDRVTDGVFLSPRFVREKLQRLQPDGVVGGTIYGSFALAQAQPQVPFWADQFGHVMAEAQAKAFLDGENWPLAHFWQMVEPVIRNADRFSSVSDRQRYATIGELGAFGRLTSETCGYEFTCVIPCALIPDQPSTNQRLLRRNRVPDDAFLVLWSGGFNVWSDVDTLYDGVVGAMARDARIHFASTGGGIRGHDDETYARFESLVAGSRERERFHLEGWVRSELVPAYVEEADLGVLTERPIYEGLLGSKNRIIQWMGARLPVAYNRMGDLGDLLAAERLGLTFAVGDAQGLQEAILWAASHPGELTEMTDRACRYAKERLTFEATTRGLLEWAQAPAFAPDHSYRGKIRTPADHAAVHQKIADRAKQVPVVQRSPRVRSWWKSFVERLAVIARRSGGRMSTEDNRGS